MSVQGVEKNSAGVIALYTPCKHDLPFPAHFSVSQMLLYLTINTLKKG